MRWPPWPTPTAASGRWRRSTSTPRRGSRRCSASGGADGGGVGGRTADVELPGRAAARAVAALDRLAAERHRRQARRRPARRGAPRRSTPNWSRHGRIWTPATSTRRSRAYQAILDAKPEPRRGQGRGASDRVPQRAHRPAAGRRRAAPTPRPTTSTRRSPPPTSRSCSRTSTAAFDRLIALVQAHRRRRPHGGPDPADRAVRSVRPSRSRGHRRATQPRQRALLTTDAARPDRAACASGRARTRARPAAAAPSPPMPGGRATARRSPRPRR